MALAASKSTDTGFTQRIASWLASRRQIHRERQELAGCGTGLEALARDVGVSSPTELLGLIGEGPHSADLLADMASTLSIPLEKLKHSDAGLVRALQVNCSRCGDKGRCKRELSEETAALNYHDFCPNAETLDAMRG